MDKDKKTLIISFIGLIILLVVIYSFGGGTTGQSIKDQPEKVTKIYVSSNPDLVKETNPIVKAGEYVYLTVETGSKGTEPSYTIFEKEESTRYMLPGREPLKRRVDIRGLTKNCAENWCPSNIITESMYLTEKDWSGTYCVEVKDNNLNKATEECFEVE